MRTVVVAGAWVGQDVLAWQEVVEEFLLRKGVSDPGSVVEVHPEELHLRIAPVGVVLALGAVPEVFGDEDVVSEDVLIVVILVDLVQLFLLEEPGNSLSRLLPLVVWRVPLVAGLWKAHRSRLLVERCSV